MRGLWWLWVGVLFALPKDNLSRLLKTGSPEAQALAWERELADHPDDIGAQVGLGKALAKQGRCRAALEWLGPNTYTIPFGRDAALAAARCSIKEGFIEDALYYDQIALQEAPADVSALTLTAIHRDRYHDPVGRDAALSELMVAGKKGGDASLYAQALIALRRGDIDAFDICRTLWKRSGWGDRDLKWLEAQAWLDLDDPWSAQQTLEGSPVGLFGGRGVAAEAMRRMGYASETISKLEDTHFQSAEGSAIDAILIRAYTDIGDTQTAQRLIAPYLSASDPDFQQISDEDILASQWYLARAQGNTRIAQHAALRWESVVESPLRRLEYLIPIGQRN